jgi:hypothetical protein
VQPQISTAGNIHQIAPRAMNAAERDHLAWWLRVIRESTDGAPYLVTFRGETFPATPEQAVRVMAWRGRIEQVTYTPRRR